MLLYMERVFVRHQVVEAAAHDHPRGNLSDLYPRWLGARELLLHGRDPYSAAVTREIQTGYYGRRLDAGLPGDPKDQQAFSYPVYVVFLLAPTINLPFPVVQKTFFWILLGLAIATPFLWLRILRWRGAAPSSICVVVLTIGSLGVVQGLKLQQLTLVVAAMIALAIWLLAESHLVPAGVLLALTTIKPQLVWLLLLWLALWTLANLRGRYPLAAAFLATMTILLAASESYLPYWLPRFLNALRDYQRYTGGLSILDQILDPPFSWALELGVLAALLLVCWRERRCTPNSAQFIYVPSLALAVTIVVVPSLAPYNQILLLPALLMLWMERRLIWRRGPSNRILSTLTAALIVWPWISSTLLALLSYLLPPQQVEQGWAIPFWTVIQAPIAVTALLLVHYYQVHYNRGTLAEPLKPSPS